MSNTDTQYLKVCAFYAHYSLQMCYTQLWNSSEFLSDGFKK